MPEKSPFRQTYGATIPDEHPRVEQIPGLAEYLRQLQRAVKGSIEITPDVVDSLRAVQVQWQVFADAIHDLPANRQVVGWDELREAGLRMSELFRESSALLVSSEWQDQLRSIAKAARQVGDRLRDAPQFEDVLRQLDELREVVQQAEASIAPGRER